MLQLRPYQQEAVDAVYAHLRDRDDNPCIVLPTGCHAKGHPILMFDGNIKNVEEIVHAQEGIKGTTKQISAQILIAKGKEMDMSDFIENDDLGFDDLPISMLFGVEESYWDLFPKVNLVEGRYPQKDTNEVMIDTRVKNAFESLYKKPLNVGDDILMLGANTNGVIREGKLVGIFDPPNENSAMFQIVYCDPDLARAFADLTYAANFESELIRNEEMFIDLIEKRIKQTESKNKSLKYGIMHIHNINKVTNDIFFVV